MKTARGIAFVIMIASGMLLIPMFVLPWITMSTEKSFISEAGAVGIIGGADGPTSIFVSTSFNPSLLVPIVFLVSLILWLIFRHKHLKSKDYNS